MSYKDNRMENKTLPVALLVTGIVCIMILSCCFVWLVVRCERWRRRRKYRPKGGNRYSLNAANIANGLELRDLAPRQLKPSLNLINYSSKHSITSQSIPSLLSADSMDDSIASEPLYSRGNYAEDEPDTTTYFPMPSIKRILGSFPELPFYRPPSVPSSSENIRDGKRTIDEISSYSTAPTTTIPIPRPRSSLINSNTATASKDFSNKCSLQTKPSVDSVNRSQSSAESLRLEIPGGTIRIRDMSDIFDFTRLRAKKGMAVSTPNVSETIAEKKEPTLETEV